jgi:hypothetical protein
MSQPIGIDVTGNILARMDGIAPLFMNGIPDVAEPADEDQPILTSAVLEAISQYRAGQGRGFLLCDRMGPLQAWYIPQSDRETAVTRVRRDTRRRLATMLAAYDPDTEAVVVTTTLERIYLRHINLAGAVFDAANHRRIPIRLPPPVKLPPEVLFEKVTQSDGTVAYTFSHDQWGLLGRVVVSGHGAGHIKYGVHPAPDPLSHPNYRRKLQLFEALAKELEQKFLAALGQAPLPNDGRPGTAQTVSLAKLYAAFMNIPNDFEMARFVQRLSVVELDKLVEVVEEALPYARGTDATGTRERLATLQQLREAPAAISPVVEALYNYLQLDTEAEGRAFLLDQADRLLTDEAEAAMAEFWGHGPESQAHVERFRALLQRVRRETKTN